MGMYDFPYLTKAECESLGDDGGLDYEAYRKWSEPLLQRAYEAMCEFASRLPGINMTVEEVKNYEQSCHITDTYPGIPGVTNNFPGSDLLPAGHNDSVLQHILLLGTEPGGGVTVSMLEIKQWDEKTEKYVWMLQEPEADMEDEIQEQQDKDEFHKLLGDIDIDL